MAGPVGEKDWYVSGVFNMAFINLNDTFGDYVDRAGLVPKVNAVEDALEPSDAQIDSHVSRHESGGADELGHNNLALSYNDHHGVGAGIEWDGGNNVAHLGGVHESGGALEINVGDLVGVLADRQKTQTHASRHKDGGVDELDASELAGVLGVSGEALISDGAAAYWGTMSVGQGGLKTSLGSVSTNYLGGDRLGLPGGSWAFSPEIRSAGSGDFCALDYDYDANADVKHLYTYGDSYANNIYLATGDGGVNAYARVRYITASGEVYWIFLLLDKKTKAICSAYQAPDHPCFCGSADPELTPHPFPNYDPAKQEIVVINPDMELMRDIHARTPRHKDLLETLFSEYEPDLSVSPAWPDKQVGVDINDGDWPFNEGKKPQSVKQQIPQPSMVRTAGLKVKQA